MKQLLCLFVASTAMATSYPKHWWAAVPTAGAPKWEILPQEAKPPEVILSKRNELGILSNFAATPFRYRGKTYASVEGFWQAMLYPENESDHRAHLVGVKWRYTRKEVEAMTAFQAKEAGDIAYAIMKERKIDWVSFEGKRFVYWTPKKGEHYDLIVAAMWEKLKQNPKVKEVLLATEGLTLRPDHVQEPNSPPAWRYFEIWMEIRKQLIAKR